MHICKTRLAGLEYLKEKSIIDHFMLSNPDYADIAKRGNEDAIASPPPHHICRARRYQSH